MILERKTSGKWGIVKDMCVMNFSLLIWIPNKYELYDIIRKTVYHLNYRYFAKTLIGPKTCIQGDSWLHQTNEEPGLPKYLLTRFSRYFMSWVTCISKKNYKTHQRGCKLWRVINLDRSVFPYKDMWKCELK